MRKLLTLFLFVQSICICLSAQDKKTLEFEDMIHWNSFKSISISNDSKWVVYESSPLRGDGQVVLHNIKSKKETLFPRATAVKLSPESNFMIYKESPSYASIREAYIKKLNKDKMPKDSVHLYHFEKGRLFSFSDIKQYNTPKDDGNMAVFLIDKKIFANQQKSARQKEEKEKMRLAEEQKKLAEQQKEEEQEEENAEEEKEEEEAEQEINEEDTNEILQEVQIKENKQKRLTTAKETQAKHPAQAPDKTKKKGPKPPTPIGDVLIVYQEIFNDTLIFQGVTGYDFSEKNGVLTFSTQYKDSVTRSTIYRLTADDSIPQKLFSHEGLIKRISMDKMGENIAFMQSSDTTKVKNYQVWLIPEGKDAHEVVGPNTPGMPEGYAPNTLSSISFSHDGQRLFFGTAPLNKEAVKDTVPAYEIPTLDLWSWTDKRLQPQQQINLKKDLAKTFDATYNMHTGTFCQLADSNYNAVVYTPHRNEDYVLIKDDSPYLRASSWEGKYYADWMLLNTKTNERSPIVEKIDRVILSPSGDLVLWFNSTDLSFHIYDINTQKRYKLTDYINYALHDEEHDTPSAPSPYGVSGWTKEGKGVIINDKYDIWEYDFSQGDIQVKCITQGFGRKNKMELRPQVTAPKELYINLDKEMILYGRKLDNNEMSILSFHADKRRDPKVIMSGPYKYSSPRFSNQSERILFSKQNINTYPDYYLATPNFKSPRKITNINPQQADYNWAQVEAVSWTSFAGDTLNGLLYKPENFNPNKKYPMLVYFYERMFNTQFSHYYPAPSRSSINPLFYASNDYLVFIPDIVYGTASPGMDAYNCIVSGVENLTQKHEWIDKKALGLQGQSWGGYQTAFLITKTKDMFAAAMGGAVVSNMTSAYGGIRWGTGMSRMFQYEKTQSRIGKTLWEDLDSYISNSPLFYADKIQTPLLMMHNDQDDAVPWYQGIELFSALRRLDKPVWMLNYNKQPHNLKANSVANRLDLSIRMKQFFDHYLKGAAAPQWLKEGIPAIEKRKNLGY